MNFLNKNVFLIIFMLGFNIRTEGVKDDANKKNKYSQMAEELDEIIDAFFGENNVTERIFAGVIDGFFKSTANLKKMKEYSKKFGEVQEIFGKDIIEAQKKNIQEGRKALLGEIDATVKDATDLFDKNLTQARKDVTYTLSRELHETIDWTTKEFDKDLTKITDKFSSSIIKSSDIVAGKISEGFGPGSKVYKAFDNLAETFVGTLQQHLIFNTGLYIAAAMAPILAVRYGYHYFIKKLNDPTIIIETSIGSWPYELAKRILRFKPRKPKEKLENMILDPETKAHIGETIELIRFALKNNMPLGNILFTGHPGNGKTYFAKALAGILGMDYIILTGSSFFQENAGVKAIDQIFGKMTKGKKTIIFIDEVESLVASRNGKNTDGDGYRLVNQLLNYTSEPSKDFILIGATNHSSLIDAAFHRRFQYVIEMPLPGYEERKQALTLFRNKQLINKQNSERVLKAFSDRFIKDIATQTEGLSFAELQTIIDYINGSMRISEIGITKKIIDNAVSRVLNKEKTFNKTFIKK